MAEGTCKLDGCDRPRYNRGWCAGHASRVRRHGDPGSPELNPYRRAGCQVDGCEREHFGQGFCQLHRYRWATNGDPLATREHVCLIGEDNPAWRGDEVRYQAVHARLRRVRGRAALFDCVGCGDQSSDWAYTNNSSPSERFDPDAGGGMYYSTNPDDYVPMCRSCHRLFDRAKVPFDEWNAARS